MLGAPIVLFGPDHGGALLATAVGAGLLVAWGRAHRGQPSTRMLDLCLGAVILAALVADPIVNYGLGYFSWSRSLPMELCDAAGFACVVALWTRAPLAFELAYYWGLTGALHAQLTPAVEYYFPHVEFLRFFLLHGAIVGAALYLSAGLGLRPRPGAVRRVFGWTLAFAACVAPIDWALEANYVWLCFKPPNTVLDLFGPWPWYLAGGAAIALLLFWLLTLPFRTRPHRKA